MPEDRNPTPAEAWARLRFAVIGGLLSSPPPHGKLAGELERLSDKKWRHPMTGQRISFGVSTIEAWYYAARRSPEDPVGALRRQVRSDAGTHSLGPKLIAALGAQYKTYPSWSYLLHVDNLASLVREKPEIGPMRSYSTIRRYMKSHGMKKAKKSKRKGPRGHVEARWEAREVRSFEAAYVGSLWHLDFHHGSRKILAPNGHWYTPIALGIHDDRSRLACHVQWYLTETAEDLVHGLCQALQKWQLPRAILTDNGAPMRAEEFVQGLERLGITHETTLPYSPYQNAKEETFWNPLEGRLMAMLKEVKELTLSFLNKATQAWVDLDYNRKRHSEIGQTPLNRYVKDQDVLRPCPSTEVLHDALRRQQTRRQRHSDGTVSIENVRFEIPAHFRHVEQLTVRYARWNLQRVHLVDPRTGTILCRIYPLDKEANADGRRRRRAQDAKAPAQETESSPRNELPPYLREILARYNQSGKPPGYIPKPFGESLVSDDDNDDEMEVTV